jgi:hypothetical protein
MTTAQINQISLDLLAEGHSPSRVASAVTALANSKHASLDYMPSMTECHCMDYVIRVRSGQVRACKHQIAQEIKFRSISF